MNLIMDFLWFCAGGKTFFIGTAFIIVGLLLLRPASSKRRRIALYSLITVAIFLIFLSAAAISPLLYIIWAITVFAYLAAISGFVILGIKPALLRGIAILVSLSAVFTEAPYHSTPRLPKGDFDKLYIIGDSVAAGLNKTEYTWPEILRQEYRINVADLSQSGATVGSALHQVQKVNFENGVVLLEIGGNDLFASTPIDEFERDLGALIEKTIGPGRLVLMLELPLQARHIRYGMAQRKLAKDKDIILIPKSFLVSVFSARGATIDLAHLSPAGHRIMAEKIRLLLGISPAESQKMQKEENRSQPEL